MDTRTILRAIRSKTLDTNNLLDQVEDEIGKCEKQISMVEDAVLVYHMQRAPTHRTWYVAVGNCRGDRAKWIINDFKDMINKDRNPDDVQEQVFLPRFADNEGYNTCIEDHDLQTTWDGGVLLDTFYQKRARLLSLYSRLYEAVESGDISRIVQIICESSPITWRMR